MTEAWTALHAELDAWAEAGRAATFWWRDDDAVEPSRALDRLLALAEDQGVPLCLAVIPARCGRSLPRRLERAPATLGVLQHGFAHLNHAAAGEKKVELGRGRALPALLEELARGRALLLRHFPARGLPVLVPPWNRLNPALVPALPSVGLSGLSVHGPRAAARPAKGLWQTNTHVDIMRWAEPRGFLGEEAVLNQIRDNLRMRRTGGATVDPDEPTGLLTHHLAHDEAAWRFLARLVPWLAAHPACRLLDAAAVFSGMEAAPDGGHG